MYDEPKAMAAKMPDHLEIATKMAREVVERYDPEQQNEVVRHFRNVVLQERKNQVEEAAKRFDYLKSTLEGLGEVNAATRM